VVLFIGVGQAMTREVEQEPVWRRLKGGQVVEEQMGEGG
jgi:hypothetical protein